ncbi:hypothetical protein UG55_102255 [Frankia sp. EI5c]|uniref:hypothetical protein n=1 Tax=Frankia sp. EI5c TaxID=683316 RepID=UPI0007C2B7D4|nr:hypothetical protein [Frankia sp. EI5c]OAA25395.1 hypothetical protein UG55_102255 [Frankia sp. EI5c]
MTNNPAIHRRASGDIDIAVPHETEPSADILGVGPLGGVPVQAGPEARQAAVAVPEAA